MAKGFFFHIQTYIIKIEIHSSCEIEYFVETHIFKLCVTLRSRVLRVVCPHFHLNIDSYRILH